MYPLYKMKQNETDGSEYCINEEEIKSVREAGTKVGHCNCDYCGADVIAVWDKWSKSQWYPYLGNQARRPNSYKYSPIIQIMRERDKSANMVWNNNLLNVHARAHSKPNNWAVRASSASIRILCNSCFQKTYRRVKVHGNDGILYELSVLPERGETVESVMKDLGIDGRIEGSES